MTHEGRIIDVYHIQLLSIGLGDDLRALLGLLVHVLHKAHQLAQDADG